MADAALDVADAANDVSYAASATSFTAKCVLFTARETPKAAMGGGSGPALSAESSKKELTGGDSGKDKKDIKDTRDTYKASEISRR
jgi:hypothetical protein